jgi:hypothetical protein
MLETMNRSYHHTISPWLDTRKSSFYLNAIDDECIGSGDTSELDLDSLGPPSLGKRGEIE